MARFTNRLDQVRIAAPCSADWDRMGGTDRVRFCGQCNLNVYNLSSMTRIEAESFIARNEGRLCVRFYRRRDGSILTKNCPVGLKAIRRRLSNFAKAATTIVLSFFAGVTGYRAVSTVKQPVVMGVMAEPIMGDVMLAPEVGGLALNQRPEWIAGRLMPIRKKVRRRQ